MSELQYHARPWARFHWCRKSVLVRGLMAFALGFLLAPASNIGAAWAQSPLGPVFSGPGATFSDLLDNRKVHASVLAKFPKWTGVLRRYSANGIGDGEVGNGSAGAWNNMVKGLGGKDRRHQIEEVNRIVNRISYRTDTANYGRQDYWATPSQFFALGGDCEDYAFAKFTALRALGFANSDLRLVVAFDLERHTPHAMLIVYFRGQSLVLDSQLNGVVSADSLSRYVPYYSINEEAAWIHFDVEAPWSLTVAARKESYL